MGEERFGCGGDVLRWGVRGGCGCGEEVFSSGGEGFPGAESVGGRGFGLGACCCCGR